MNKKTCIAAFVLGLSTIGFAQQLKEADVPAIVKKSFNDNYPGAKADKWEKEDGGYEADFVWDDKKSSAVFDAEGKALFLEQAVELSSLPKTVTDAVAKNFAGYAIKGAELIVDPTGVGFFELSLSKGNEQKEVKMSDLGEVIKEDASEDVEEANDED